MSDSTPAPHIAGPARPESEPGLEGAEHPAAAPAPSSGPAPAGPTRRTIVLVLVAAAGMYIMVLTLSTALSLRLASIDPDAKETSYSLTVSVSSIALLVAVPLAGALSDRTTSRFGRRRPWILGCLVAALLGTAVIGAVSSIPVIVVAYVVAIIAAQAAFNAYSTIPVEALPDVKRGRVMGVMGMFGAFAMSGGSYLAAAFVDVPLVMMVAPILLALALALPLLFFYKDPVRDRSELPPLDLKGIARTFVVNPRKHPDFGWAWLSRFLAGIAMSAMFSYFVFFLMDGLHMPIGEAGQQAGTLSLISAPVSVLFFTASGWVSDKIGRRKPFVVVAALLMAAGLVIGGTASTFAQFIAAWIVFSMGQAMYLTVDMALCAAVLPDARDTGKDVAVIALALSIPNIIVPAAAPTILATGDGHNYQLLWFGAAAICALGSFTVTFIKSVR
ncbi:MFS transporter [Streptomyces ochraceiscleroticus]|uniref:MFS transporter n=2 Tax=Streptomyces ochraceiscleroticus TaxID=47761 RepID=A0ABW1MRQ6_9ACTN|nr:MFS transporter [Streptomyces ochraceiscleroticus]